MRPALPPLLPSLLLAAYTAGRVHTLHALAPALCCAVGGLGAAAVLSACTYASLQAYKKQQLCRPATLISLGGPAGWQAGSCSVDCSSLGSEAHCPPIALSLSLHSEHLHSCLHLRLQR